MRLSVRLDRLGGVWRRLVLGSKREERIDRRLLEVEEERRKVGRAEEGVHDRLGVAEVEEVDHHEMIRLEGEVEEEGRKSWGEGVLVEVEVGHCQI